MPRSPRTFNLVSFFAVVSFVAVMAVSVVFAAVLSHFVGEAILRHDAALTSEFVNNLADTEALHSGIVGRITLGQILDPAFDPNLHGVSHETAAAARAEFLSHVAMLPDVVLVKIFSPDHRVIWSTDRELVGLTDPEHAELAQAFRKKLVVSHSFSGFGSRRTEQSSHGSSSKQYFVEDYIPLVDTSDRVIAVVEIYKEPKALRETIATGRALVWTLIIASAQILYLALFWIVRRADRLIKAQQKQLIDSENLVVIGEMSAAVAHGIRNPLAAIRSSAELALESERPYLQKNINDIIRQTDRLGSWVRDLLTFAGPLRVDAQEGADLHRVLEEALAGYSAQCEKQGIRVEPPAGLEAAPTVQGSRAMVAQVLESVLANAVEAMPEGGVLRASIEAPPGKPRVRLTIQDSGPGMSGEQLNQVLKPFYTTKPKGLGVGLALAKRIMDRLAGRIELESLPGAGTQVHLVFCRMERAHG